MNFKDYKRKLRWKSSIRHDPGTKTAAINPHFTTSGDAVGREYHGHIHAMHPESGEHMGTISYAYLGGHDPSLNLLNVEVQPQYRRQGIGTALAQRLKEEFSDPQYYKGLDFSPGYTTPDGTPFQDSMRQQGISP